MQKKSGTPCKSNFRSSTNLPTTTFELLTSKNKTEDTTPRYNNDNQSRQFGNQRTMTVAGARETVGSQVVQQTGIQCFNCKGYGHYAKESEPKRVKDLRVSQEKMMMANKLNNYMAKIQDVSPEGNTSTVSPIGTVKIMMKRNTNDVKQLKKANASLTQELEKCKTNLDETNRLLALKDIEIKEGLKTKAYEISVLNQKHDELVKKSLLTKSQLEGYLKENTKVISDLKVKEEKDIDKMIEMTNLKFLNEIVYTRNQSNSDQSYGKTMTLDNETDQKLNTEDVKPEITQNKTVFNEIFKTPSLISLSVGTRKELGRTMWKTIVNHTTSVSRPQLKCYQVKDKVLPNNSQQEVKKKEIVQLILFIVDSGCTKHMTGNLSFGNFVEKVLTASIHNLSRLGQVCDAELDGCFQEIYMFVEIFRETTLLTGIRDLILYTYLCKKQLHQPPICAFTVQINIMRLEYLSRLNPQCSAQNRRQNPQKITKRYMPVRKVPSAAKKPNPESRQVIGGFLQEGYSTLARARPRSSQTTSDHNRFRLGIETTAINKSIQSWFPKVVPLAVKTATSRQELEFYLPPS
ncbi:hypothetical protein Tco_0369044 [Tanacetum coccineum]